MIGGVGGDRGKKRRGRVLGEGESTGWMGVAVCDFCFEEQGRRTQSFALLGRGLRVRILSRRLRRAPPYPYSLRLSADIGGAYIVMARFCAPSPNEK